MTRHDEILADLRLDAGMVRGKPADWPREDAAEYAGMVRGESQAQHKAEP